VSSSANATCCPDNGKKNWRRDIQQYGILPNATQPTDTEHDKNVTFSIKRQPVKQHPMMYIAMKPIMLSFFMLSVFMLSVFILSVFMLSV
jgi:hypothetical protein